MKNYKNTLNLPKTDFPMKANLAQREPEILKSWQEQDLYARLRESAQARPKFILNAGPPYANARPHLGTALNNILKDMVLKSKSLSGFNAPFVPGWDCHGLPIELNVEKKVGKAGDKISKTEFRQACRDYANSQVEIQKADFERLGVIADWHHPYLTMSKEYEANTVRALAEIIQQGHLLRGSKPVYWCVDCASALSEAEVEYQDKSSPSIDVAFVAKNPKALLEKLKFELKSEQDISEISVPIWTTTPWTLAANYAVALNAKLNYVLVKVELKQGTRYLLVAEQLLDKVMQRYAALDCVVLAEAPGEVFENLQLQHPFLAREVPIILGEHVTTESGTGNVHTAPAHGQDDYYVGLSYGLPIESPVNSRSCFAEDTPLVGGQHVLKANQIIIDALAENGSLLHQENIQHSYPHCWRHKTPVIFRATPQWFISMDRKALRVKSLEAIKQVQWIPEWGELRINNMVEQRPDWCISRQRTWGTPIALFMHKSTGELHPETPALMEKVAQRIEQRGMEAWFESTAEDWLGKDAADYDKCTDTLDVWFDAGVNHYTVLEKRAELQTPADLYLEGSDQHRGWFQASLLTSMALRDQAPFKTVLTHGYVVDGKGKKMSKSIGNVVQAHEVVQKLGADVLRLWVSASDYRDDINFSDEILNRSVDTYRRLRNTARFLLSNLFDFDPAVHLVHTDKLVALDYWAINHTRELQARIIEAYDRYQFQHIYQLIHNFCSVELGSFYLDIIKDRQYTSKTEGVPRRSAQTAMFHILEALVRWLAPLCSFTAEEIWRHMPGQRGESVMLTQWYEAWPNESLNQKVQLSYWPRFMLIRNEVNKAVEAERNAGLLASALQAEIILYAEDDYYSELSLLGEELRFALITSAAKVLPAGERPNEAKATGIDKLWVQVKVLDAPKCVRCWQHRQDVGDYVDDPELCGRCVGNVAGAAENREFA